MCWQGTVIHVCGHRSLLEQDCTEVLELDLSFSPKWRCPHYRSNDTHVAHPCGIWKVYCGKTPYGAIIDNAIRNRDAIMGQIARISVQLKRIDENLQWRARQLQHAGGLSGPGNDPEYTRLRAIACPFLKEREGYVRQVRTIDAFLAKAKQALQKQQVVGNAMGCMPGRQATVPSHMPPVPGAVPTPATPRRDSVVTMASSQELPPLFSPFIKPPATVRVHQQRQAFDQRPILTGEVNLHAEQSSDVRRSARARKDVNYAEMSSDLSPSPSPKTASRVSGETNQVTVPAVIQHVSAGSPNSQHSSFKGGPDYAGSDVSPSSSPPMIKRTITSAQTHDFAHAKLSCTVSPGDIFASPIRPSAPLSGAYKVDGAMPGDRHPLGSPTSPRKRRRSEPEHVRSLPVKLRITMWPPSASSMTSPIDPSHLKRPGQVHRDMSDNDVKPTLGGRFSFGQDGAADDRVVTTEEDDEPMAEPESEFDMNFVPPEPDEAHDAAADRSSPLPVASEPIERNGRCNGDTESASIDHPSYQPSFSSSSPISEDEWKSLASDFLVDQVAE